MPDAWIVNAGIVEARLTMLADATKLPAGRATFLAEDYAESAIGTALLWPRAKRDALLAATDWTQAADAPLTADQVTTARAYRTALRNLPATCPDAASVTWPAPVSF